METSSTNQEKILLIKWALSIILPLIVWFLPLDLPSQLQGYLAITLWALIMWIFELLDPGLTGTLLCVFYILFHVSTPQLAFSGWLSSSPWLSLGALIFGTIMVTTGLARRLTYAILSKTGTSFIGIVFGILLVCTIINPFIPSATGKLALMLPLIIGVCQVMNIQPKSKEAAVLMIVLFNGIWSSKMAYLTASVDSVILASLVESFTGYNISWSSWFYQMTLPCLLWTVVSSLLAVYTLKPERIYIPKDVLKDQYKALGSITAKEIKASILLVILALALVTDRWHGINPGWTLMVMAGLCFVPGINLLTTEDFQKKINFPIVFFLASSFAIGSVAGNVGFVKIISDIALPLLQTLPDYAISCSVWLLGFLGGLVLSGIGLSAAFTGPISGMLMTMGFDPFLGAFSLIWGFNLVLFPYQCGPLILVYGFGYVKMSDLLRQMIIRAIVGIIFFLVVTIPYFKLIGLFDKVVK
ncbi:SLC13 family permease [Selenomonadales bacterium OttesenSCG-928-I06]|nr:SLC13 family permease [Selenomonadales bacterium OttesenSCG-928-I06]